MFYLCSAALVRVSSGEHEPRNLAAHESPAMRTFLVSYDLAQPDANKPQIVEEIMSMGQAWARPLDNMWYVRAEETRSEIEARISRYLGGDDGLVIQEARGEAAFLNTGLRWFRQRRRDAAVAEVEAVGPSNVIAFPAPVQAEVPAIEDMEPELELFPLRAAS
jgi:hypothetical protein